MVFKMSLSGNICIAYGTVNDELRYKLQKSNFPMFIVLQIYLNSTFLHLFIVFVWVCTWFFLLVFYYKAHHSLTVEPKWFITEWVQQKETEKRKI